MSDIWAGFRGGNVSTNRGPTGCMRSPVPGSAGFAEGARRSIDAEAIASGAPRPPEYRTLSSFPVTVNDAGLTRPAGPQVRPADPAHAVGGGGGPGNRDAAHGHFRMSRASNSRR